MNKIEQAENILKKYNQSHIKVNNEELAEQILSIDFEELNELYNEIDNINIENSIDNYEPVKAINPNKISNDEIKDYIEIGKKTIKNGNFAVAVMAGGQGSRLGHSGPKGTFKIELNGKEVSLFELIIEKLKRSNIEYGIELQCYIMTSPENNAETVKYFEDNNYFGYNKEKIKFFMQDDKPLLNKEGKLLLGEDGLIKLASDGNGSIFSSMRKKRNN